MAPERVRTSWPGDWAGHRLQVVLYEPEIPPYTGNIARLCAATGARLHLVEPLGFQLTDRYLKRAGLDYWDQVDLVRHSSWAACRKALTGTRMWFLTTAGERAYTEVAFQPGDALVFGPESRGLPPDVLTEYCEHCIAIPTRPGGVRSINLSSSVGIVLYEGLRQLAPWRALPTA